MSRRKGVGKRNQEEKIAACPECPAGVMHMDLITYFTWLNGELITVPNFPAWVCDICGRREFDPDAVTRLNALLQPAAGRPVPRQHVSQQRQSGSDRPQP